MGNAVNVRVAEWVGRRLRHPRPYDESLHEQLRDGSAWPRAAWGDATGSYHVALSSWPTRAPYENLATFLNHPMKPLSARAAAGFLERTSRSTLHFPEGLLNAVDAHLQAVRDQTAA